MRKFIKWNSNPDKEGAYQLDNDMPLCRCLLTDAFCLYIPLFCTWTLLYGRCIVDKNYMIKIMEA